MRLKFAVQLSIICFCALVSRASADPAGKRVQLRVTFADGTALKVTQVEGATAEVTRQGSSPLHLGLIPSLERNLVTVQVVDLAKPSHDAIAKVSGPLGEPLEVWCGGKTSAPPTLTIVPQKVD